MTRRHMVQAGLGGICFFAATFVSEVIVRANGVSVIWIPNAVLLGLLMSISRRRSDGMAACVGAFFGNFIASQVQGHPVMLSLPFALADVLEAWLAARILSALGGLPGPLARVHDVIALMIACVVAPAFSAPIGAAALALRGRANFLEASAGWYISGVLSLALIAPAVVTAIELVEASRRQPLCARKVSEVIVLLGLVASATIFIFYFSPAPALFALFPLVLLATFRLRQFGAVAAVALVATLSAHATAAGVGPIAAAGLDQADQLIYLQVFLAVTFLAALPVAAALAERDARAEEAHLFADHFKAVVENVSEVIFRIDRFGRWTYLNPAWELLSGYSVAESIGRSWDDWVDPEEHREVADWAAPVFAGEVLSTRRLLRLHTADDQMRWMELSIQALTDKEGAVAGATGTLRDVHDRKRLEEQVMVAKRLAEERERAATLLASTDELTGLANRRAFLAYLDRHIAAAGTVAGSLAVAIFDVDHFKAVNDRHGHAVGDLVLQRVAARAVGIVRGNDVVGRLGGEEFGILMPGATLEDAAHVAERLRIAVRCDAEGDEEPLPLVTVSVGIAAYLPGQTGATLLNDADTALYSAKGAGRNRVRVAA